MQFHFLINCLNFLEFDLPLPMIEAETCESSKCKNRTEEYEAFLVLHLSTLVAALTSSALMWCLPCEGHL